MKPNKKLLVITVLIIALSITLLYNNHTYINKVTKLSSEIDDLEQKLAKLVDRVENESKAIELRQELDILFLKIIRFLEKGQYQKIKDISTSNIEIKEGMIINHIKHLEHSIFILPKGNSFYRLRYNGYDDNKYIAGYEILDDPKYSKDDSYNLVEVGFLRENDQWKLDHMSIDGFDIDYHEY